MPLTFTTAARSHVGKVRKLNEDRHLALPQLGLWAVADGMGGLEGGDVAASTVARLLGTTGQASSAPDLLARFEDRIIRANREVRTLAARRGSMMGATVVALLVHGGHYAVVWSGDSRAYRIRDGKIAQLSHDHSVVQEMIDAGTLTAEEAKSHPRRNVITHAIGVADAAELDIEQGEILAGDRFVLCSDGLTGHVEDAEIAKIVADAASLDAAVDALVDLTLERGARDNVTVILVACSKAKDKPAA